MTLYLANQGLKFTIKSHFWWDFLFSPFHLKSIPLKSSAKNEDFYVRNHMLREARLENFWIWTMKKQNIKEIICIICSILGPQNLGSREGGWPESPGPHPRSAPGTLLPTSPNWRRYFTWYSLQKSSLPFHANRFSFLFKPNFRESVLINETILFLCKIVTSKDISLY